MAKESFRGIRVDEHPVVTERKRAGVEWHVSLPFWRSSVERLSYRLSGRKHHGKFVDHDLVPRSFFDGWWTLVSTPTTD